MLRQLIGPYNTKGTETRFCQTMIQVNVLHFSVKIYFTSVVYQQTIFLNLILEFTYITIRIKTNKTTCSIDVIVPERRMFPKSCKFSGWIEYGRNAQLKRFLFSVEVCSLGRGSTVARLKLIF